MICRNCHERLESWEIETVSDSVAYGGYSVDVPVSGCCPVCGSEELSEEAECVLCGGMAAEEEMSSGLCPACVEETREVLQDCWSRLSEAQRDWACEHDEWMEDA
ncbi:MAG: hypothetical protein IJU16_05335 [Clostridia bacterium]|nr:hypothetical protein [Clostridia bacterium]